MKKIFWTSIFWIAVVVVLAFYAKFDKDLGASVSTWLGGTQMSGTLSTTPQDATFSGVQATLTEIQTKLDQLLDAKDATTPVSDTLLTGIVK